MEIVVPAVIGALAGVVFAWYIVPEPPAFLKGKTDDK